MTSQFLSPLERTPSHLAQQRLAMALYGVAFSLFAWTALSAPESSGLAPIFASALVGSMVAIFWVWSWSERPADGASLMRLIAAGIAIDLAFNFGAAKLLSDQIGVATVLTGIGNLGVLCAAMGAGILVARGLQKPNYLVMAAIVGALTDIFSVYAGPSKHVSASQVFYYLSFQWGLIGMGSAQPIVGAGDFIFLTLYFFGARKFGLDSRKTLGAMMAAIAAGFAATLLFGAVPALPFMSVALLLVHGRELKAQMRAA